MDTASLRCTPRRFPDFLDRLGPAPPQHVRRENDNAAATGLPTAAAFMSAYIRASSQSFAGRRRVRRRSLSGRCLDLGSGWRGRHFGGRSGGNHFVGHGRGLVKRATQRAYNATWGGSNRLQGKWAISADRQQPSRTMRQDHRRRRRLTAWPPQTTCTRTLFALRSEKRMR